MYEIIDIRTAQIVHVAATYAAAWLIVSRNPWLEVYE